MEDRFLKMVVAYSVSSSCQSVLVKRMQGGCEPYIDPQFGEKALER